MRSTKTNVKTVGTPPEFSVIPRPWPAFPEPLKSSAHSPYRAVLLFQGFEDRGVRVIVEGKNQKAVEAYCAEIIRPDTPTVPQG